MIRFDKATIIREAWRRARATALVAHCSPRVYFASSLRQVWAEHRPVVLLARQGKQAIAAAEHAAHWTHPVSLRGNEALFEALRVCKRAWALAEF